ncbi:MAG: Sec-independent protein secretion pathway component [Streptomycetaceae bacterium]|nr:MAG: Sec-independent protein secretion pathway component [Streptomycetaceae bacterium]
MFFDLGGGEIMGLAVLALILLGPERLPKFASDAATLVRKIQKMSHIATQELRENLGPGFEDLQPSDLNPKTFIKKHINATLDEVDAQEKPTPKMDPDLL